MTSTSIQILPEHIIDQIKAGEVIERPANIIKELLENSIDAGAKNIEIQISDNGLDLISITDDGKGMNFNDLPYAFARHATSKIKRFEDLYTLNSFGFRGEALASIASVSKLTCRSNTSLNDGGIIKIEGGNLITHQPSKDNKIGTSIYIKDIFFNTPARLKFLKSKDSEKNTIKKILNAFLIANPSINFSIRWDEEDKEKFGAENRVQKIFFKNKHLDKTLINFIKEHDGHKIEGQISKVSSKGNINKQHFIFANNRIIQDKKIHHIIINCAKSLWVDNEIGHYSIFLTIPEGHLDVNVHPSKTTVKFFQSSVIYALISTAIKDAISNYRQTNNFKIQPAIDNNSKMDSILSQPLYLKDLNQGVEKDFSNQPLQSSNNQSLFSILHIFPKSNILIKIENDLYILKINKLFGNFIISKIEDENFDIPESKISPLLITIPFKISEKKIDCYFEDLKKIGLECDRLDDSLIVLRTLPTFFNKLPYRDIVEKFLNGLSTTTDDFKKFTLKFFNEKIMINKTSSSIFDMECLCQELGLTKLIEKGIIQIFTEDDIKS